MLVAPPTRPKCRGSVARYAQAMPPRDRPTAFTRRRRGLAEASNSESKLSTWLNGSLCQSSVAFCFPAKSLTFSGLMETPLVGKQLKS